MRLIDADALKKALAKMWYDSQISITGISVSELIDSQPTISARPTGEWIEIDDDEGERCSECSHVYGARYNFCPNCGADMRGGEDTTGESL